jgi:tRNA nucleotidyltransferase (CCA-adding enzyme)
MAETPASAPAAADLREQLRALPGGPELLAAAAEVLPGRAFLVGGAVRDMLLGARPRELDVVVEGGGPLGYAAAQLAGALATRVGAHASVIEHERFGTAIVEWEEEGGEGSARVDIATARREHYAAPGALPQVELGSLVEDLQRRDFTVDALACALDGAQQEEARAMSNAFDDPRATPGAVQEPGAVPGALEQLRAVPGALEDLRARRLRVLHERSFLDDPTRLWRLARYRARLDFAVEEHTAQLAANAVADGALQTVSLARIGAELRLALGEADPVAALAALDELGLLAALHRRLWFDTRLARDALELLSEAEGDSEPQPRSDLVLLAVVLQPMVVDLLEDDVDVEGDMDALLEGMEFRSAEIALVTRAAICADAIAEELARAEESSEVYEAASFESLEGVALAGAWDERSWSNARIAARRWMTELRNIRLEITGADLLAAGLPEGPEIGRRLRAALCAKLDGELDDGREAELAAALQLR